MSDFTKLIDEWFENTPEEERKRVWQEIRLRRSENDIPLEDYLNPGKTVIEQARQQRDAEILAKFSDYIAEIEGEEGDDFIALSYLRELKTRIQNGTEELDAPGQP